ncbi:Synapse-associated protein, partial [Fasciola gigantica]
FTQVPLFREFQKSQAEFEAERCQKYPELNEPTSPSDANCLPWHPDTSGITDPAAVADLRARILALSQYPNTFLLAPPAEAQLGSTSTLSAEQWLLAKLLLEEDPKLAEMRYNLVPSRISEDLFWRNYFYRMTLLRQSAHLAAATGADTQPEMNSDSGNFVYIEENDQQPSHESDQLDASEADTKSAENEHKTSKRRGKNKNHSCEKVKPTTVAAETEAKNDTQVDEKTDKILSVDELLDAELAREVDELVLVSSDDPLNDELDRELEMELAQIDKKK